MKNSNYIKAAKLALSILAESADIDNVDDDDDIANIPYSDESIRWEEPDEYDPESGFRPYVEEPWIDYRPLTRHKLWPFKHGEINPSRYAMQKWAKSDPSDEQVEFVVTIKGWVIKYLPKDRLTEKICKLAVTDNPELIVYLRRFKKDTPAVWTAAIKSWGNVIQYAKPHNMTEENCMLAVHHRPANLQFIPRNKQTKKIINVAVRQQTHLQLYYKRYNLNYGMPFMNLIDPDIIPDPELLDFARKLRNKLRREGTRPVK